MKIKTFIMLFLTISCCMGDMIVSYGKTEQAEEIVEVPLEYPRIDLLIVIDTSGSMNPKSMELQDMMKMVCALISNEQIVNQPEVVVFNKQAISMTPEAFQNEKFSGETSVMDGINAAKVWLEEKDKQGAEKPAILFLSDLLATRTETGDVYNKDQALLDQEAINETVENWQMRSDKGEMSYLFLTWDSLADHQYVGYTTDYIRENVEAGESVGGVQFRASGARKLKAGSVNGINMRREVIQHVMGLLVGQELNWVSYKNTGRKGITNISSEDSYKQIVMVESDSNNVRLVDQDKEDEIIPFYTVESVIPREQIYLLQGKSSMGYQVHTSQEGDRVSVLTIPKLRMQIWFDKTTRFEGEIFNVYTRFIAGKNDVRSRQIQKGMSIRVLDQAGNLKYEEPLILEDDGNKYCTELLLEKAGTYRIQIYGNQNRETPLGSYNCLVRSKTIRSDTSNHVSQSGGQSERSDKKYFPIVIVVGMLVFLGGVIAFVRKKR